LAGCPACRRDVLCDAHAEAWIRSHRGTAAELGVHWAAAVASGLPHDRATWSPWPAYDEPGADKLRRVAWRKVVHQGLGDHRVTTELARACAEAARAWYERRRQDPSALLAGPIEPVPFHPTHHPIERRRRKRLR